MKTIDRICVALGMVTAERAASVAGVFLVTSLITYPLAAAIADVLGISWIRLPTWIVLGIAASLGIFRYDRASIQPRCDDPNPRRPEAMMDALEERMRP